MKRAALLTSVVVGLAALLAFPESAPPAPTDQASVKAGAQLFSTNCSECHRYGGKDGLGKVPTKDSKSPDLKGFASREWLTGFMDPKKIETAAYFGNTKMCNPPGGGKKGKMVRFVLGDIADYNAAEKKQLKQAIVALSAEAGLEYQKDADKASAADIKAGRRAMNEDNLMCSDCHAIPGMKESGSGPDLIGYGSRKWLIAFMKDPEHKEAPHYYSTRWNEMPKFDEKLTEKQMGQIADFIRATEK